MCRLFVIKITKEYFCTLYFHSCTVQLELANDVNICMNLLIIKIKKIILCYIIVCNLYGNNCYMVNTNYTEL